MATVAAVDTITPFTQHYLDKAEAALRAAGRPVGRAVLVPGNAEVWDDCCTGMLYVRVVGITPILANPQQGARMLPCGILSYVVTLAIGVIRCAHTVDDNGKAPSAAQITGDAEVMTKDLAELQQVLVCDEFTRSILTWLPKQVTGGCHGGEWTFTVSAPACPCPQEEP